MDISENLFGSVVMSWWEDKSDAQAPQVIGTAYQLANPFVASFIEGNLAFSAKDNNAADWWGGKNRLGDPETDTSSQSITVSLNWEIDDDLTLTSLTSYSDFDNDSVYNMDGFGGVAFNYVGFGGATPADTITPAELAAYHAGDDTLGASSFNNQSEIEAWSQELRLSGNTEDMTWILGAYYSKDEVESNTIQFPDLTSNTNLNNILGINIQGFVNESQQDGEAWAVFSHTEWDLNSDMKLTVGLRHTEDEKEFSGCTRDNGIGDAARYISGFLGVPGLVQPGECLTFNNTYNNNTNAATNAAIAGLLDSLGVGAGVGKVENTLDETSTSGKIALDYNLSEDIMAYISYSRGFKSGSFPTLVTNDPSQLDPVTQEKLKAWEIGMKARLLDGAMQLNAALFDYDYTDKQLLSRAPTVFGPLPLLANVPESSVQGAEFDLQWQPAQGLYVALAATYIETNVDGFGNAYNQEGTPGSAEDSEFPLTPKLQANALINYEWNLTPDLVAVVGTDASYSGRFNADYKLDTAAVGDEYKLDSSLLIGLRAGVRSADDTWSVTAWGRNITDEYNPINARKNTDLIVRFTGMGATYGITGSYHWM